MPKDQENYKGKNVVEAHRSQIVTEAQFYALVGGLVKAVNDLKVPMIEK
jgi:hypothetical protein